MVKKINIKSSIRNYEVNFISHSKKILLNQITDDDFLIIDEFFLKKKKINDIIKIKFDNIISIKANENSKEFSNLKKIIEELLKKGIKKNSKIIGCGGGITQDITAFISSILFRGVEWIFLPTTLLAQGDSCIGSKSSINFGKFKNQLGTFYPPSKIFIDIHFLTTLSLDNIYSGLGEISHYLIIGGKKSFSILEKEIDKKQINFFLLIIESLKIKKKIIEIDEYDTDKRNILNYGHTFGHAIESTSNYNISHGISVSIGIDISNFYSVKYGFLDNKIRLEIKSTLKKLWNKNDFKKINVNKMIIAIKNDKKSLKNSINLILCKNYGNIFKHNTKLDNKFNSIIHQYFDSRQYE